MKFQELLPFLWRLLSIVVIVYVLSGIQFTRTRLLTHTTIRKPIEFISFVECTKHTNVVLYHNCIHFRFVEYCVETFGCLKVVVVFGVIIVGRQR